MSLVGCSTAACKHLASCWPTCPMCIYSWRALCCGGKLASCVGRSGPAGCDVHHHEPISNGGRAHAAPHTVAQLVWVETLTKGSVSRIPVVSSRLVDSQFPWNLEKFSKAKWNWKRGWKPWADFVFRVSPPFRGWKL